MKYMLAAVEVPDQERLYYAGPIREVSSPGRVAHKVTFSKDVATVFNTREEAEEWSKEFGGGYIVVEGDAS